MAGMIIEYPSDSESSGDDDEATDSDDPFDQPFRAVGRRGADDDSDASGSEFSDNISDDELDKFMTGMLKTAQTLEEKFAAKTKKGKQRNEQIYSNCKLHAAKQKQKRQATNEIEPVNRLMDHVTISGTNSHNDSPQRGSQSFTKAGSSRYQSPSEKYTRAKSVGIGGVPVKCKHTFSNVKADLVASQIMAEDNSQQFDIWDYLKKSRPVLPPIATSGNMFQQESETGGLPGVDV